MFGVGFFELIIIAVVALVVVGPKRLPEVMKQAGRLFVHVRRTANDVRSTFEQVIREAEDEMRREEASSIRDALKPMLDAKNDVRALLSDQASPRFGVEDHPGVEPPPAMPHADATTHPDHQPAGTQSYTPGSKIASVPATAPISDHSSGAAPAAPAQDHTDES